ncbi:unnamed protein product [Caenorhabditis auriculariae]|uniref:Uncharacterized protein n=1 Tax=Caenorhabditis auriculariae TaxID=2777116 RepID=A0A8S1HLI5_9PELO|nr:unnamed protein product [Caenorhabditis auriculariae]
MIFPHVVFSFSLIVAGKEQKLLIAISKIPGPFAIPIIGATWQFKWNVRGFAQQLHDWGMKYGKQGHGAYVLWLGPRPVVVVIRPETAKAVLESNDIITKGPEYDILVPWLGTGLLIATGEKWRHRRKMLTPSFHFNVLNGFQSVFDDQSKVLIEKLVPLSESGAEVDLAPYIKRCALDIICETAMGTTVDAQNNHSHPYVLAVQEMNVLAFQHTRMPWLRIKAVRQLTGYQREYDSTLKILTDFTRKVIDERSREFERLGGWEIGGKRAFLDLLIEMKKEGGLTEEDIREEVETFMFEGHDTTSVGISWALWCLAHNQDVQRRAHEELDAIFEGSMRDCTIEDLKKMKYLDKCIKEALRIRPSVPNITRSVDEDFLMDDILIPKGSSIMVAPSILQNNPMVYENPDKYDPDRFNEENVAKRHPFAYVPFSAGPRNCIGQKFALQEEKTVISWVLRKFELSSKTDFYGNYPLPEVILRPEQGIPITLRARF